MRVAGTLAAAVRTAWARLTGSIRRDAADARLDAEVHEHLALLAQDYEARGLSPSDAAAAARRAFGNVDRMRMRHREARMLPGLSGAAQDILFACRLLVRDRAFTITAALVLGVGIGVNNMMFTLIYSATLRGLPIENADRLLHVSTADQRFPDRPLSHTQFVAARDAADDLADVAAFTSAPVAVADEGRAADRFDATYITAGSFAVTGTGPRIGRPFTASDDQLGAPPTVILGDRAWRERYAADPSIVGRAILIDGAPATVIGVMPAPSRFPTTAEIWLPLSHRPGFTALDETSRTLRVLARARSGVEVAAVRLALEAALVEHARAGGSAGVRAVVVPINQRFFGRATDTVWLAFIAASLVVVAVSCANAANLVLARAVLRSREMALRTSLGASRGRIVRQLVAEAAALAAAGAVVGFVVSAAALHVFNLGIPPNAMPYWQVFEMDGRVLAALVAVSGATVFVVGVIPALQASRIDVNSVMKDGAGTVTPRARWLTTSFTIAQLALSVVLLAQTVVATVNSGSGVASDAAVHTADVLTFRMTLPGSPYDTVGERATFFAHLTSAVASVPGVTSTSVADVLPLFGGTPQTLDVEGRPAPADTPPATVMAVVVSPGYFETFGLPLHGRNVTIDDGRFARGAALINQRLADLHFADTDPLGRRIRLTGANSAGTPDPWLTIVGIAPNIRQQPTAGAAPLVYLPLASAAPSTAALLVRTTVDATAMTAAIRDRVATLDPGLPLYQVRSMRQVVRDAQWNGRMSANLITMLTIVTLSLAVIGIYAVTAQRVALQAREIGVRMALGAGPQRIARLVLTRTLALAAGGLLAGFAGAAAWFAAFVGRSSSLSGRPELSLESPLLITIVAGVVFSVTLVACIVPLRRALGLDPSSALRSN